MNAQGQIFQRGAHFNRQHAFGNEVRCMRTDQVNTDYRAVLPVADHLGETMAGLEGSRASRTR